MKMEINGQWCITEVGHGLDVDNLETTATWVPTPTSGTTTSDPNGADFDAMVAKGHWLLHTPRPEAAKIMAVTAPFSTGTPCVAVVFARMILGDEDKGVRPFVVDIHDGDNLYEGISVKLLPPQGGSDPLPHSITYFNNSCAVDSLSMPNPDSNKRFLTSLSVPQSKPSFAQSIYRVSIGALALSLSASNYIKLSATIGLVYSGQRCIGRPSSNGDRQNKQIPIITFSTQQYPILTAVAQAYVLDAFYDWVTEEASFLNPVTVDDTTLRIRRAMAGITKAMTIQFAYRGCLSISERCGWRGLFRANMMSRMHALARGLAIAEGDIVGVSMRTTMELLLGRYKMPLATDPQNILAKHEQGLLQECREVLMKTKTHRSEEVNNHVLPRCQKIVEAIGHRLAYEAAAGASQNGVAIPTCVLDLFKISVVRLDEAWYIENIPGLTRKTLDEQEVKAMAAVLEIADRLIEK
ncbi:hypothetical protein D9758_003064 [Tetrapyrgos nigripes]|uniref:Acyl-CoA oxidase C-alpha1 domain-containing protein n=1 Tax=Tetrapyrgos nigripes TaxID=182062 RepID=A0A8H5GQ51_9AGAR|nr:hypothetical protein D9758_003064 [Tetrapyrgos nigripes]